jgi:hypothetical protein
VTEHRQHAGLSSDRWASFPFAQQVLMIGNEMNRGLYHLGLQAWDRARRSYERVLQLVDLTVGLPLARSRRRELLRWRDLVALLYLDDTPPLGDHVDAFRCLLRLTPESSRQIAELPGLSPHRRAPRLSTTAVPGQPGPLGIRPRVI